MSAVLGKRVVVTGISVVSPLGVSIDQYWKNLLDGVHGIGEVVSFDPSEYRTRVAGQVQLSADSIATELGPKSSKLERVAILGLLAAKSASKDAGIDSAAEDWRDTGVVVGSGVGGMIYYENQILNWLQSGPKRVHPTAITRITPNTVSSNIAIHLNFLGPDLTISTACSSGAHAIGVAYLMVKYGVAKRIITGGCEAPITPVLFAAFDNMKVMSVKNTDVSNACKPFDSDRDGFVLGEGGSMLVLEDRDEAIRRKANIYAEVLGYGQSNGGHHMVIPAPNAQGETNAIKKALAMAEIPLDEIGYINAHGTGTIANDVSESLAINNAFDGKTENIEVSSTKSLTGHLIGASGALGCVTSILSIKNSIAPQNANLLNIDPKCNLNLTVKQPKKKSIKYSVINSFGFGNNNASLVVGKYAHEK